jgi:hypothetical protein
MVRPKTNASLKLPDDQRICRLRAPIREPSAALSAPAATDSERSVRRSPLSSTLVLASPGFQSGLATTPTV